MSDLQERLDRAERALTRAGFTLVEGAQEWKPPIGPSASPLLDRIDLLTFLLRELRDGVEGEWSFPDDLAERIDALLAGQVLEAAPDAMVSLSDIASLQRYTLGSPSDWHTGAEMERDNEGEYVLLDDALMLAAPKPEGAA